jgi:hypothetical protein
MEMYKATPCIAILNKQKYIFFQKIEKRKVKQVQPRALGYQWKGGREGKGCRRVIVMRILCTCV